MKTLPCKDCICLPVCKATCKTLYQLDMLIFKCSLLKDFVHIPLRFKRMRREFIAHHYFKTGIFMDH
jgi:hypothetical protein